MGLVFSNLLLQSRAVWPWCWRYPLCNLRRGYVLGLQRHFLHVMPCRKLLRCGYGCNTSPVCGWQVQPLRLQLLHSMSCREVRGHDGTDDVCVYWGMLGGILLCGWIDVRDICTVSRWELLCRWIWCFDTVQPGSVQFWFCERVHSMPSR